MLHGRHALSVNLPSDAWLFAARICNAHAAIPRIDSQW
jgi:hypothetical protein